MRSIEKDLSEFDKKRLANLKCEPWMADLLKLNPSYTCWGPGEDYMHIGQGNGHGWDASQIYDTWKDFGPWALDELNECAHFYFELGRDSKTCDVCKGDGYHPDAQWISESFYPHSSPFLRETPTDRETKAVMRRFGAGYESPISKGSFPSEDVFRKYRADHPFTSPFEAFCLEMKRDDGFWCDKITQDEVDALVKAGRLGRKPVLVQEVNAANRMSCGPWGDLRHDSINRSILIEARCKRLGVPLLCEACEGSGHIYTAEAGHAGLVLWMLHPRKGCSRGVEIKKLQKGDLPKVVEFLCEAAKRNAERFAKVTGWVKAVEVECQDRR